ncbi:hypothetical protein OPV22_024345 [Ensete ventricosum]|uniref:Uncharacterized protein n=1 Tax=Ensete ventricosum TaxID=4639 RepID=A0AAV8QSQ5_ENSVE|nr:hypothetical protein OPV22_024345 [Ensete ventricosum]
MGGTAAEGFAEMEAGEFLFLKETSLSYHTVEAANGFLHPRYGSPLLASGLNGQATALHPSHTALRRTASLGFIIDCTMSRERRTASFLPPLLITRGSRPANNTYTIWFTISRSKPRKATRLINSRKGRGRSVAYLEPEEEGGGVLHPSLHLFILRTAGLNRNRRRYLAGQTNQPSFLWLKMSSKRKE